MQAYDTNSTPALSRTWEAKVIYRECGVVTDIRTYEVTISKIGGCHAEIDGKPADVLDAARILSSAKADNGLNLIRQVRPFPASMALCLGVSV